MQIHSSPNSQQLGFSLIELIIAIALGIFLILGVLQVYVDSKATYRTQDALARMQENARFAIDILARDFRQAGYIGCGSAAENTVNTPTGLPAFSPADSIVAYQSTSATAWDRALPASLKPSGAKVTGNSDVVSINSAGICAATIKVDTSTNVDAAIEIEPGVCDFATNDIVLVSDCNGADVIKIKSITPSTAVGENTSVVPLTALSRSYLSIDDAEIIRAKSRYYYVAQADTARSPSLYMKDTMAGAPPVPVLDDVESLQLTFGEDLNNNGIPNSFVNASAVTDWTKIISVKVSLLLRSPTNIGSGNFTYNEGGTNITYEDGVLRKAFNATIRLRNRGLKE